MARLDTPLARATKEIPPRPIAVLSAAAQSRRVRSSNQGSSSLNRLASSCSLATKTFYEARLAQRQYDVVDPSNRLVAAELERRWNEKLERVAELERAFVQAERDAEWKLTAEERAA